LNEVRIAESARKRNIADEDILHAYTNHIAGLIMDNEMTMLIGPATDGTLLEVGVVRREGYTLSARHGRPPQVPKVIAMPRTLQEILEHADELAERFENHEPAEGDRMTDAELALSRAVIASARSDKAVADAVAAARATGSSWTRIATLVGTSAQSARERFGAA
jgi:hypothetical protein